MENNIKDMSREDFDRVVGIAQDLIRRTEEVVVGKHTEIVLLVTALLSGGHVLIEDVPGVGKTTLASTLARAAGLDFRRAQFTPDVMASDITGFNIYNRTTESFEFQQGLVMTNILLADEINRASPKTQSALLEAMEECRVTVDGKTYDIPSPFMVIATQNPTGFVGTYPLPEAQLDRFAMKISMGYPTPEDEIDIVLARKEGDPANSIKPVANGKIISGLRQIVRSITIDEEICRYVVTLVGNTRAHSKVALGASPRASIAVTRIAQAYAFLHGRSFVIPEDVAAIFRQAVAHRLVLKQEAKLAHVSANDILTEILHTTEVPFKAKR